MKVREEIYKTAGNVSLKAYIFKSADIPEGETRPAILFFHGGGWQVVGENRLFEPCEYFARRGWVSISIQYRLSVQQGVTPVEAMKDAKSAVRWARVQGNRLNIDPDRIIAAGSSAGGHLAVATATVSDIEEPSDPGDVRGAADALVLFYPVTDTTISTNFIDLLKGGTEVEKTSPYHNLYSGMPPAILFHGTSDTMVPFSSSVAFVDRMKNLGNVCEFHTYEGEDHFLFKNNFDDMMEKSETFLKANGFG